MTERLVLGPLLRYVDETSASVWVETAHTATVSVHRGGRTWSARTFAVHGHHYALVELDDLTPGSSDTYTVAVDGDEVWPSADSPLPSPRITPLTPDRPLRIAFGSCRTSVTHDAAGNDRHGVDALRAYALRMAGLVPASPEPDLDSDRWPDLVLFLGDQVYADETTDEMRAFITARRDIEEPPWTELQDYEEYAHLYSLAWSDPTNAWLLSTLPSAMIFDDHDVRDDWNTSLAWREKMEATTWWRGRIVAGLASYWVYQHLGNLSPAQRAEDEIWKRVCAHEGPDELDLSEVLDEFAYRADQDPSAYRWSYAREYGDQARLVVVDSRAARVLGPRRRSLLDPVELAWLEEHLRGDVDHLLVGTSLPFLLAEGLHNVEAACEELGNGAWGSRGARFAEWARQTVDLEHWAAFQDTFRQVATSVLAVAAGERGRAPVAVTFLSGDVHHSYVSEARPSRTKEPRRAGSLQSRIVQAVCSPIRNPLPRSMRFATAVLSYGVAGPVGRVASKVVRVPHSPLRWHYARGPWFDNNLAFLELARDGLRMWWVSGTVVDGDHRAPRLKKVADYGWGTADDRDTHAAGAAGADGPS